ncbi:MAG TPA: multiheme c-type cytochrome, partial [Armatimonadota bacterium]|nr:multiheme c-type cytochrome [Armatimonadota bacterium]
RYYAEAAPASRPAEAPKDTVDYVMRGWADAETCGTCHPKELEAWKGTAHAKAIATLAQAGRLVDECLACHSEEFRQRKAFDPVRLVPGDGVTCATCHGDGLIHSMTGRVDYIRRTMDAQDCMACHNEERQPAGFDFAASHDKIRHLPAPAE